MAAKDFTGERFGMLVAAKMIGQRLPRQDYVWTFNCDCGGSLDAYVFEARRRQHCGCKTPELLAVRNVTHGQTGHKLYKVWAAMKDRCRNPNNTHYRHYGGRGISVCERWNDFALFLADMGEQPEGGTVERVDNSLGYCPENCIWATRKSQMRNRRVNVLFAYQGESKCLAEWSEVVGINQNTLRERLRRGWDIETAFTTPAKIYKNRKWTNRYKELLYNG